MQASCKVVSAYAAGDAHAVQGAVDGGLRSLMATASVVRAPQRDVEGAGNLEAGLAAARLGGPDPTAKRLRMPFPDLDRFALVAWRLGMAQAVPFVRGLSAEDRGTLVAEALGRVEPLARPSCDRSSSSPPCCERIERTADVVAHVLAENAGLGRNLGGAPFGELPPLVHAAGGG
jgi:hypothetical protein